MKSEVNKSTGTLPSTKSEPSSLGRRLIDRVLGFTIQRRTTLKLPAIKGWKTSIPYAIAGMTVSWLTSVILVSLFGWAFAFLAKIVVVVIYAWLFYPSYFKPKPLLCSPRLISFANFALSGFIFGPRWNSNLTDSNDAGEAVIGVSYLIAPLLYIVVFIDMFQAGFPGLLTFGQALALEGASGETGFVLGFFVQCMLLSL